MLRWLRRPRTRVTGDVAPDVDLDNEVAVEPPKPVGADRLSGPELKLLSCAQQLSDAARVLLSGFLTVTGPEGARRVPIDPGVANAVLADRLRDYDGAEMEVRVMAAQTYMPKEI